MSKSWKGGSTRAWRLLRQQVLLQNQIDNEGRCRLAIDGVCTGRANTVHHTLGRAVTGDDPRYLMATCAQCNRYIGEPAKHTDPPSTKQAHWS
jgi:hypothetical protein